MNILLVDDNDNDAELMRIAIQRTGSPVNICHASDGNEALDFLRREGGFADAPAIDLALVDLNMPGMDGRQLIAAMKSDDALKQLPIVVITSSTAAIDISDAYRLGASSYLAKPVQFQAFQAAVDTLIRYWVETVQLPEHAGATPLAAGKSAAIR